MRAVRPFEWISTGDDPQFSFRLKGPRPRYLLFLIEGIDSRIEPSLYFDGGEGFSETTCLAFREAGRFVLCLELHRMPEVARVRLDPMSKPGRIRFLALGSPVRWPVRWLMRRLGRRSVASGPTRMLTLKSSAATLEDLGSGLAARRYLAMSDHYADVLAQARDVRPRPHAGAPMIAFLVPTYNTKPAYLDVLYASFAAQAPGAELIFSDDGSTSPDTLGWLRGAADRPHVKVVLNGMNRGIAVATNVALAAASATFVALVDHDDALSEGAVAMIAQALAEHPETLFLYTDEVIADAQLRPTDYFLKPAYDPVLLTGVNYLNHLSVYRRDRLLELGGLRSAYDGSQDYDLLLRYLTEVPEACVRHLPFPAYIWRRHPASFSTAFEDAAIATARRALADRFTRGGQPALVGPARAASLHRIALPPGATAVSVVIPNRNAADLMQTVLEGLARTVHPVGEVIVVDNGSDDPAVFALYAQWQAKGRPNGFDLRVVSAPGPFNFSRSVNVGIAEAAGDLVLLLNNDIEVIEPDWLGEMVACFTFAGTGIVGARLLYPDGSLQHAGVVIGLGDLAGHWFCSSPGETKGPMGRLTVRQRMGAVTGAAMLVSRTCLQATGPFDEERFAVAYNDIDFCLRARAAGFHTVWTPFATLTHHESKSRGSDMDPRHVARFRREQQNLRDRHGTAGYCDRAFSPWYTRDRAVPGLRALDALPASR